MRYGMFEVLKIGQWCGAKAKTCKSHKVLKLDRIDAIEFLAAVAQERRSGGC